MGEVVIISAVMALAKIVETVSSGVEGASSAASLFKGIDQILHAQRAVEEDGGELSLEDAAELVIIQKRTQERISRLRTRVDHRFGNGTWAEVTALRNDRLASRAAAVEAEKERIADRKASVIKVAKEILTFLVLAIVLAGVAWTIWRLKCRGGAC